MMACHTIVSFMNEYSHGQHDASVASRTDNTFDSTVLGNSHAMSTCNNLPAAAWPHISLHTIASVSSLVHSGVRAFCNEEQYGNRNRCTKVIRTLSNQH